MENIRRKCNPNKLKQSLVDSELNVKDKLIALLFIALGFSAYILHAYKICKRSKINSYVINQMFKFQVFIV